MRPRRDPPPLRLVSANLDKDRGGDDEYVRLLRRSIRRRDGGKGRGILGLVEDGHGTRSTRLVGVHTRIKHLRRIVIGDTVHNGVARAWVRVERRTWAMGFCGHGPHRASTSQKTNDNFWETLARDYTRPLNHDGTPWFGLFDGNNDPQRIATTLGGIAYSKPGDPMCIVISPGLAFLHTDSSTIGQDNRWTKHIEVHADVVATKEQR